MTRKPADKSDRNVGISLLVIAVLGVALCGFWARVELRTTITAQASTTWPTVPAEILSSRSEYVLVSSQSSQNYHTPRITYRYVVNGTSYDNDLIQFSKLRLSNRLGKTRSERIAESYRSTNTAMAHYNPDQPSQAVLEPGITRYTLYDLANPAFGLLASLALGGAGLWFLAPRKKI